MLTDRNVQEIGAKPLIGDGTNPFSAYLTCPNIVLLGDPGAGKTHLFTEFAKHQSVSFHSARSFLNISAEVLAGQTTFFIDALDERRSARGDSNATDEIVKKLFLVKPKQVRISCRAADWLGETDLAAFKDYFDGAGGCVVLSLQTLSRDEQIALLGDNGVGDADAFLAEAESKGLVELLGNPQNLKMLAGVVGKKGWPTTRSELFKQAVEVLLTEKNENISQTGRGRYSAHELIETAGEICAVRLIGDIQAISLKENDEGVDIPSYRTISKGDKEKTFAVLGRRLFAKSATPETVDYAHRVIAEFIAASWLATRIRAGLPLGRVSALIGIDGRPATELRGLHAWLAVQLPEQAELLINADPFGVLTYGDASALTPTLRKQLLRGLAKLADADPWFRAGHWTSTSLSGLAGADVIEDFRSILSSKDANFSLRTLVLDALAVGQPIGELAPELLSLALNTDVTYAERDSSVDALIHIGATGRALIANSYEHLGDTPDDLRLKAKLFKRLVGAELSPDVLPKLIFEFLSSKAKATYDVLYGVSRNVPDAQVSHILDQLADTLKCVPDDAIREGLWSLESEFDRLLFRGFEIETNLEGQRLLSWLECRKKVANFYGDSKAQSVNAQLAQYRETTTRGIQAALLAISIDESIWAFIHRLQGLGLITWGDISFLRCVMDALDAETIVEKKVYLYDLALSFAIFQIGPAARCTFESLLEMGDAHPRLAAIRSACCFQEIPDWRTKDAERNRQREQNLTHHRTKNRADFEKQIGSIRHGMHYGWLGWIASVYFGMSYDLKRDATPHERLVTEFGAANADIAVEGMLALIHRQEIAATSEILRMHGDNKCCVWWYAIVAGLDLYVAQGGNIDDLGSDYLKAALLIDAICTTLTYDGNTSSQDIHPWKTVIIERRPALAATTYSELARFDLARSAPSVFGLHELLHNAQLEPFQKINAFALLADFPDAPKFSLKLLIQVAMTNCDPKVFAELAKKVVNTGLKRVDSLVLWLAAGYVLSPDEFVSYCDALDETKQRELIWALRDVCGHSRRAKNTTSPLSNQQLEQILRWIFGRYPRTAHPDGVMHGDENRWDATDFALRLIALLSADSSTDAAASLQRLVSDPSAQSYTADIKHAIAQQRVRLIDAQYCQPTVEEVVQTLSNGSPSSVSDLHALLLDQLHDLRPQIASANIDIFKGFWNEDSHGKVTTPKNEESCRDYLVGLLRTKTNPKRIALEPEIHMAADKRADIVALMPGMKLVIEVKRDYHPQVWVAIQEQLERFYTRDPEATGYGIYLVLWFGPKRRSKIRLQPSTGTRPASATEMQHRLEALIPEEKRFKIGVVVLDVSGEIPTAV